MKSIEKKDWIWKSILCWSSDTFTRELRTTWSRASLSCSSSHCTLSLQINETHMQFYIRPSKLSSFIAHTHTFNANHTHNALVLVLAMEDELARTLAKWNYPWQWILHQQAFVANIHVMASEAKKPMLRNSTVEKNLCYKFSYVSIDALIHWEKIFMLIWGKKSWYVQWKCFSVKLSTISYWSLVIILQVLSHSSRTTNFWTSLWPMSELNTIQLNTGWTCGNTDSCSHNKINHQILGWNNQLGLLKYTFIQDKWKDSFIH